MLKIKTVCKWTSIGLIVCLLTGCWDKTEVEEKAYVIALGLDLAEEENKLKITFLIANPEVGSQQGGGGSNEKPKEVLTIHANDFVTAKNTANALVAREITYDLLKIMIVSEKLAKHKDFIRWMYDSTKDREIRRDTFLAVCPEEASEYLKKNNPKMETRPHKYFQFMINRGIRTGLIPDSDLHRFFKTAENDADLFLAMYTTSKPNTNDKVVREDEYLAGQIKTSGTINQTQFIGSAVFKEGMMIDKLNGQETRVANVLDDTTEMSDILITLKDPFSDHHFIAGRIIKDTNNKIKMNIKNGKLKATIEIPIMVEVLSDPGLVDFANNAKNRKKLEDSFHKQILGIYQQFIKKTQTELKGSPYALSVYSRKHFSTLKKFEDFDWMKSYPDADIDVKVSLKITEFGKQVKVMPLQKMRD